MTPTAACLYVVLFLAFGTGLFIQSHLWEGTMTSRIRSLIFASLIILAVTLILDHYLLGN